MKKISILVALLLGLLDGINAQDISGEWKGILKVQGMQLRIEFNISRESDSLNATMNSPDQMAYGIPVTRITFNKPHLAIEVSNLGIAYNGTYLKDSIVGTFSQLGQKLPLLLKKEDPIKELIYRPQEPKPPFPYLIKGVTFSNNTDNVTLAGTLTLPDEKGQHPVVILITGSGPQDRNEEIFNHKPFWVITDYLTRNGIAVLRYDERGVGQSTGDFKTATSYDFAKDVESAIDFLKTQKHINQHEIGLIGHSEGGLIAPLVASERPDVDFIVLLAGPGLRGDKILLMQQELIGRASGKSEDDIATLLKNNRAIFDMVLNVNDTAVLRKKLSDFILNALNENPEIDMPPNMTREEFTKMQLDKVTTPWMLNFIKYDPASTLNKVKCPVLALNGEKDLQVPAKENLAIIKETLNNNGNTNVKCIELDNLNHLFQTCETGAPSEYGEIDETFSPKALEIMTSWIQSQIEEKIK